ncbi:ATP-binding protein [Nitrosovibrio sp. Nv17]|uniref:sensor histidine kinase n=1 Tax=Nitrosovibrio sp. Nv17 TaxID=1855339 RepID=UPI000908B707|nr:ATP-binding protein [Nitrosovibrio sp. Nv17]SFW35415.1 two-component system, NtrC family, sensor histidine kinase GlrK [Nitrosovibrio sp. Nv17]
MVAHGDTMREDGDTGIASRSRLQDKPKNFLKLILLGFALVGLPPIIALVDSAFSIDRMADQSRKAVYRAAQIAHGSRVLADEIAAMERAVRQTHILGDTSLLENYFRAHEKFGSAVADLLELSLHAEQKRLLEEMQGLEASILQEISLMSNSPEELLALVGKFVPLRDAARVFSAAGYTLIEREVGEMQDMATNARITVVWQLFALIPFAILLAFVFSLWIAHPMRQIDEAIRTMGEGGLSKSIRVNGPQDLRYLGERLDWLRHRLLKLEEQKTRFLQHVSHELKTPLTAMREGADLLAEGIAGELTGEQQRIARILYSNSVQLQRRIEDLLNYSALQTEKAALVKQRMNLAQILEEVLQDQNLAIMNKGLQMNICCPDILLDCERQKIKVIMDNLLSNAVKFSPPGGQIHIRAERVGEMVQFDIRDEGTGVAEMDRKNVFEPFYQGQQAFDGHVRGTGLGLSIAREYAHAHGGTMELLQHAGPGAHFRFILPVRDSERVA